MCDALEQGLVPNADPVFRIEALFERTDLLFQLGQPVTVNFRRTGNDGEVFGVRLKLLRQRDRLAGVEFAVVSRDVRGAVRGGSEFRRHTTKNGRHFRSEDIAVLDGKALCLGAERDDEIERLAGILLGQKTRRAESVGIARESREVEKTDIDLDLVWRLFSQLPSDRRAGSLRKRRRVVIRIKQEDTARWLLRLD